MTIDELRKVNLFNHIKRQLELQKEYESIRDLSADPKERQRAKNELVSIQASLQAYMGELSGSPSVDSGELPANIGQLLASYRATIHAPRGDRPTIRVLFLASSPTDEARLRLDQEGRDIAEILRLAKLREAFDLNIQHAVRPHDLTQALLDFGPQLVHFSGHGSKDGAIYLDNECGMAHPVPPSVLAELFKLVKDRVECVILNACYSKTQAQAIVQHIPFVIGMNAAINDSAAIAFTVGFYQALGAGQPIDRSFEFGLVQIRLLNIPGHMTPELLKLN